MLRGIIRARLRALLLGLALSPLLFAGPASAHQDGCHRWHSCPSDSGSYVCGDLGYTSECPVYVPPPPPRDTKPPNKADVRTTRLRGSTWRVLLSAERGASINFWDGSRLLKTLSATGSKQTVNLPLSQGFHEIRIVVKDDAGNKSSAVACIVDADTKAPKKPSVNVIPTQPKSLPRSW